MNISDLRRDYSSVGVHRKDLNEDAVEQFRTWLRQAIEAELPEPNAMTVATVDAQGCPAARILLLKGIDDRGFHFFTNVESHKGMQLRAKSAAALVFHWVTLERQVRIRGPVTSLPRDVVDTYFKTRPRGSQLGAWASEQSRVVSNREVLEQRLKEVEKRFEGQEVPAPPFWGGFAVHPESIEFWQGRTNRLHDRFLYTRLEKGGWKIERLSP